MHHLARHGSDGFVVCGTTGEASTLTDEEQLRARRAGGRRAPEGTTIIAGTGSNDTRHAVPPDRARDRARRRRDPVGHARTTTSPTGAGSSPLRGGRPGHRQADRPLQHPRRARPRHAQRPARRAARRSTASTTSSRPTPTTSRRSTGSGSTPATTTIFARTLDLGGAGGILVASHVVGDEMRRMVDEPEQRAEIDARLQRRLRGDGRHHQPDPGQGRAEHARPPRRRAAPAARRGRRGGAAPPSARCSSATGCCRPPAPRMANAKLRVLPLGGLGEIGKNMTVVEYDGPHRRRRRRPALPDRRDGRHRPRAARLRLPARARRRHRGDRHHPRPRGPPRRAAVGAARAGGDIPGLRRPADDGDGALQARRAPAARTSTSTTSRTARRSSSGPFEVELVHMTHSIPDCGAVALHTTLGTVLVTGDYKFDQTPVDGSPADVGAPGRARPARACCCCAATRPTPTARASRPARRSSGRSCEEVFLRCEGRIVVTCFASNIHRVQQVVDAAAAHGRKVALVGRSMRKNVNIGRSLGHIDVPEGMLVQPRELEDWPDEQARDHLDRVPGRAAERAAAHGPPRPSAGRAARGRHGRSSAPRRSPATSARSTRRSTASTTSAAT